MGRIGPKHPQSHVKYVLSIPKRFQGKYTVPRKSFWNSAKICHMTLGVLWSNSTHGFTLITLLLWNSVDMRSVTLEVLYTNSTHEFTPVT